jgi:hypothetical protein
MCERCETRPAEETFDERDLCVVCEDKVRETGGVA